MYAYTDRDQPGSLYVFAEANDDLENRPNFSRVDDVDIPQATKDALARAEAEEKAKETAATSRAHRVEAASDEATAAAHARARAQAPATAALATAAHYGGGRDVNPPEGVLSRPGVDATQIGANPELHPKTRAELEEKARLDAEQANNTGVLTRAELSARAGDAQIGDRPDQHPRNRAELIAAADAGADGRPITASGKALAGQDVDPDNSDGGDVERVDPADDAGLDDDAWHAKYGDLPRPDPASADTGGGTPLEAPGAVVDDPATAPAKATPAKKAAPRKAAGK
jgi:hypothetical protein